MENWNKRKADELVAPLASREGGLIPALQALQDRFGYIDDEAVPLLADAFNLSQAEVYGVISFYHDFRKAPPGRHVVRICQAEACQAAGAARLTKHARAVLGVDFGGTTPSGDFTLEPVYCLGNCACGPSAMIGDEVYGRVDAKRFDAILTEVEAEDMP